MKCPMIVKYDTEELPIENPIPVDCIKEDCAWWHETNQSCAIPMIAEGMVFIQRAILRQTAMEGKK